MVLVLTGVVAVFFLGLAFASLRRPAYAFALTMVMYPFEQLLQSQFPFFIAHRSFMNFFTAGVAGLAVVAALLQGRRVLMVDRIAVLVGLLYLLIFASTAWSINSSLSWHTLRYWSPYLIAGIVILPLTINTPQDALRVAKAFLIAGAPLAVALAIAPMKGRGLVLLNEEAWEQGNPLAVGTFGAELAVIAVGLMLSGGKAVQSRAFLLVVAALGAFVTLRSGSRGQLVATMIGIAVVSFGVMSGARRKNFLYTFIPVCILLAAVFFLKDAFIASAENARLEKRWEIETMQATFEQSRVRMASDLLYQFVDAASRNPLVFVGGLGAAASYQLLGFYCHVVPVEALCEYGVVGFILYSMLLWATVQAIRTVYRSKYIPAAEKVPVALFAGLFALQFILTFKQGSLFGHTEYFGFALVLGRLNMATLGAREASRAIERPQYRPQAMQPA
jgi:hypothetical protein